ncbi:hypothetical protein [Leptolyngbya sp. 7M]|uniref:hypothetical protein n=1 Tax=Leptolyngbya sp. 7M TaxID=2812896 RepID=UPI001B8BAE08|nr:hypothetical protein [Leptolyngbya sp. 7M]QYO64070.1 alpha-glucosidase C-terminal domain-containing protein [Leptolyngbya sp. 7M]
MSLRVGEYRFLGEDHKTYVFARIFEGDVLIIAVNAADTYGKIDLESVGTRLGAQPSYILFNTRETPEWAEASAEALSSSETPVKDTIEVIWTADNLFLALPPQTGIILT